MQHHPTTLVHEQVSYIQYGSSKLDFECTFAGLTWSHSSLNRLGLWGHENGSLFEDFADFAGSLSDKNLGVGALELIGRSQVMRSGSVMFCLVRQA